MDRESLMSKKVWELKKLCREDKELYYGFSKYTKKVDLVKFIMSKEEVEEEEVEEVEENPIEVQYEESEYDMGNILYSMFTESTDKVNELFLVKPSQEKIEQKINTLKNKKGFKDAITFEPYNDEGMGNMYRMYKHNYFKKNELLGQEIILFHGTDQENLQDILEDGFSLTVSVKHGSMFGNGIYFTNDIDKALSYSERGKNTKYVIMCIVHIGDIILGAPGMGLHPKIKNKDKRYDTSVDNIKNPIQFIKKNNYTYNILGVLKFDFKKAYDWNNLHNVKQNTNTLNSKLNISNKSGELVIVYFVPHKVDFTNPDIIKKSKLMCKVLPYIHDKCMAATTIGHKFIITNKDGTILQYITIAQKKEHWTIN